MRLSLAISLAAIVGGCGIESMENPLPPPRTMDSCPSLLILASPCADPGRQCQTEEGLICTCKDSCGIFGWDHPIVCCEAPDMAVPVLTPRDLGLVTDGNASD